MYSGMSKIAIVAEVTCNSCIAIGSMDNCVIQQERLDESEVSESESPLSDDEMEDDKLKTTLQEKNKQVTKSTKNSKTVR